MSLLMIMNHDDSLMAMLMLMMLLMLILENGGGQVHRATVHMVVWSGWNGINAAADADGCYDTDADADKWGSCSGAQSNNAHGGAV